MSDVLACPTCRAYDMNWALKNLDTILAQAILEKRSLSEDEMRQLSWWKSYVANLCHQSEIGFCDEHAHVLAGAKSTVRRDSALVRQLEAHLTLAIGRLQGCLGALTRALDALTEHELDKKEPTT